MIVKLTKDVHVYKKIGRRKTDVTSTGRLMKGSTITIKDGVEEVKRNQQTELLVCVIFGAMEYFCIKSEIATSYESAKSDQV